MSDDRSRWGCPLTTLAALLMWAAILLIASRLLS